VAYAVPMDARRLALPILLILPILSACGGGDGSDTNAHPEVGKEAWRVLFDGEDDLALMLGTHAPYHLSFKGSHASNNQPFAFDLTFDGDQNVTGTLTEQDARGQVVVKDGAAYLRGSTFLQVAGITGDGSIGDRWVLISGSGGLGVIDAFRNPEDLAHCIRESSNGFRLGGTSKINGQDTLAVIVLGEKDGAYTGTVYVADKTPSHIVRWHITSKHAPWPTVCGGGTAAGLDLLGDIDFSYPSEHPEITAPPSAVPAPNGSAPAKPPGQP
jgi:hypothetical protein